MSDHRVTHVRLEKKKNMLGHTHTHADTHTITYSHTRLWVQRKYLLLNVSKRCCSHSIQAWLPKTVWFTDYKLGGISCDAYQPAMFALINRMMRS